MGQAGWDLGEESTNRTTLNIFLCLALQQPGHTLCASRDRDALTKIGAVLKQDQASGS